MLADEVLGSVLRSQVIHHGLVVVVDAVGRIIPVEEHGCGRIGHGDATAAEGCRAAVGFLAQQDLLAPHLLAGTVHEVDAQDIVGRKRADSAEASLRGHGCRYGQVFVAGIPVSKLFYILSAVIACGKGKQGHQYGSV